MGKRGPRPMDEGETDDADDESGEVSDFTDQARELLLLEENLLRAEKIKAEEMKEHNETIKGLKTSIRRLVLDMRDGQTRLGV